MRFSILAIAALSCSSISLAAPIRVEERNFLDDLKNGAQKIEQGIGNLANSNATAGGILGTIGQSIANPKLTVARITVVKGLAQTQAALGSIASQATTTNNAGVSSLEVQAQQGLTQAKSGVDRIGLALVTGQTPQKSDQKDVAIGIKAARDAINAMPAAITTADATLSSNIAKGQSAVEGLQEGGQGVLSASGLSFADLGLPDDFAN